MLGIWFFGFQKCRVEEGSFVLFKHCFIRFFWFVLCCFRGLRYFVLDWHSFPWLAELCFINRELGMDMIFLGKLFLLESLYPHLPYFLHYCFIENLFRVASLYLPFYYYYFGIVREFYFIGINIYEMFN